MNLNKLRGLMAENSMTQSQVADMLGISAKTFNNKINNNYDFTVSEVQKLAEIFKVDINIFFK